jgi:hypothetical protein
MRQWGAAMQFHDYINLRNATARFSSDEKAEKWAASYTPDEFRTLVADRARMAAEQLQIDFWDDNFLHHLGEHLAAIAEIEWVECERPFYNMWPVVSELASSVKLDLPVAFVEIPFNSLVLRFAKGHEPGIKTAMIWWQKEPAGNGQVWVFGYPLKTPEQRVFVRFVYDEPDTPVETWLEELHAQDCATGEDRHEFSIIAEHMIRLTVFVGLLANDRDFITPIVLAKDRAKYELTDDEDVRQAIERRAVRRLGRGFDVGKALELEKEQSPHWRNPHLALFWTGKGRLKPIIKMRRGAIIHRVSMAEVPTGYLGPETSKDAELLPDTVERVAISSSKRFEIFKRDDYRCQLCGAKAADGAALHVDHRLAVAKSGSNDDDNLWTLCDRCNLGKSDTDM